MDSSSRLSTIPVPCSSYWKESISKEGRYCILLSQCKVTIDTYPISNGRTNCQFRFKPDEKPNCFVAEKMNVDRFWEVMLAAYTKCVPRE